jgi:hypothetical protein
MKLWKHLLVAIGAAILTALAIPIIIVALLAFLGIIALGVAVPEIGIALIIMAAIFGVPIYFITLAVNHK